MLMMSTHSLSVISSRSLACKALDYQLSRRFFFKPSCSFTLIHSRSIGLQSRERQQLRPTMSLVSSRKSHAYGPLKIRHSNLIMLQRCNV